MSSFGLIEENIELSDIYLAVHLYYKVCVTYKNTSCLSTSARAVLRLDGQVKLVGVGVGLRTQHS